MGRVNSPTSNHGLHRLLESVAVAQRARGGTLSTGLPKRQTAQKARRHVTLADLDLTAVYVPGKDNTVADRLNSWAPSASKGVIDVSVHADELQPAEAKKISDIERIMEEEGMYCFVHIPADARLIRRLDLAIHALALEGAESDQQL